MNLTKISFGILILFSFLGFFLLGNILHESSHQYDYKDIEKISEEKCYLTLSETAAYYSFTHNGNESEEIQRIAKYTELKAYSINILLTFVYLFCLYKVIVSKDTRT